MTASDKTAAPADTGKSFTEYAEKLARAKQEISSVVFGQERVVDQILTTILSGGHALLIGVPGLAKTLLVETTSTVMGLDAKRVQCTPDLMPADILGNEVLEQARDGKRSFRFIEGPIFTQMLMADEINRASPRTQSALLQAMQERHVTIAGHRYDLPRPFHVLATQNPIEQEGTYPLPEAQLDRFLMQVDVLYPDRMAERTMLVETTTTRHTELRTIMTPADIMNVQEFVRGMPFGEKVIDAVLTVVRRGRPGPEAPQIVNDYVAWAPGPRASQALLLAVRARALLEGRPVPSVEDVTILAHPILKHRMALNYRARAEGVSLDSIIAELYNGL